MWAILIILVILVSDAVGAQKDKARRTESDIKARARRSRADDDRIKSRRERPQRIQTMKKRSINQASDKPARKAI